MVVASFYGLKERREKQMYHTILIWTASFIFSGLIAGKTSFASAVNSSEGTTTSISPSSESGQEGRALEQLAVRLAAGGGAWRPSHDSKPDDDETKHPLDPTIPDMNCNVDDNGKLCFLLWPSDGSKRGSRTSLHGTDQRTASRLAAGTLDRGRD